MSQSFTNIPAINEKISRNVAYFLKSKCAYVDKADVDDLVQDAWLKLLSSPKGYNPSQSKPQTILTIIARTLAIDKYKKRCHKDPLYGSAEINDSMKYVDFTTPQHIMESNERVSCFDRILSSLDNSSKCIIECLLDDKSNSEIAVAMEMKEGALNTKLCRTRKNIKKLLASTNEFKEDHLFRLNAPKCAS